MKTRARITLKSFGRAFGLIIWTCGTLFLVQFILSFVFGWLFKILPFHISSTAAQTIFSLVSYVFAIIIIFKTPVWLAKLWYKKHSTKSLENSRKFAITKVDLGLNELPTWTDIGLAPVGLIVYALLASAFVAIFSIFPWFNAAETQDVGFNAVYLTSDRIFAFISLVIVAPIAEELIFRGYLYRKIKNIFFKKDLQNLPESVTQQTQQKSKSHKKRNHRELVAIAIATLLTSLAFGVMHGQWNVGVNVFAMSIVLCVMREITGSIYSGILLHMLKNAIAFYLLYVATSFF